MDASTSETSRLMALSCLRRSKSASSSFAGVTFGTFGSMNFCVAVIISRISSLMSFPPPPMLP